MKATQRKCLHCREHAVSPETLKTYTADLEHDGRSYHVELNDFDVLKCSNCGAMLLDDDANDRLFDALRAAAQLLTPSEIRGHRGALDLTQRELANYLQISESTVSRWETGAQLQQRVMDQLLRAFFTLPELRRFFGMKTVTNEPVSDRISLPTSFTFENAFQPERLSWEPLSLDPLPSGSTSGPKTNQAA